MNLFRFFSRLTASREQIKEFENDNDANNFDEITKEEQINEEAEKIKQQYNTIIESKVIDLNFEKYIDKLIDRYTNMVATNIILNLNEKQFTTSEIPASFISAEIEEYLDLNKHLASITKDLLIKKFGDIEILKDYLYFEILEKISSVLLAQRDIAIFKNVISPEKNK